MQLLTDLARRASEEGIRQFTALIAVDNIAPLRLLRKLDVDVRLSGFGVDARQYTISLAKATKVGPRESPLPCS